MQRLKNEQENERALQQQTLLQNKLNEKEEALRKKQEEKDKKRMTRNIAGVGTAAAGTIGRELGKGLGSSVGGTFGKRLGGNVGASFARGVFKTLFKI